MYLTGRTEERQIVLYEYQLGRKGEYPKEFLEGFSGYLYCDGYIIAIYAGQQRFARRHRGINAME
ncbi:transposase [Anaerobutyricum hallii]|nr:transposase [Eubacterium sp.]MBP0063915.1 transposase [Anaerobutyricum hallii]